eukprot:15322-Heterocapsa_arctica.AAC.1
MAQKGGQPGNSILAATILPGTVIKGKEGVLMPSQSLASTIAPPELPRPIPGIASECRTFQPNFLAVALASSA